MDFTLFENHRYDVTVDPDRQSGTGAGEDVAAALGAPAPADERDRRGPVATLAPVALVAGTAVGAAAARRLLTRWAERPRVEIDAAESPDDRGG